MPNNFAPSLNDVAVQNEAFKNFVEGSTSGGPHSQNYQDYENAAQRNNSFAQFVQNVMAQAASGQQQQQQYVPPINSFAQTSNFQQPNAPKPEGSSDISLTKNKEGDQEQHSNKEQNSGGNKPQFDPTKAIFDTAMFGFPTGFFQDIYPYLPVDLGQNQVQDWAPDKVFSRIVTNLNKIADGAHDLVSGGETQENNKSEGGEGEPTRDLVGTNQTSIFGGAPVINQEQVASRAAQMTRISPENLPGDYDNLALPGDLGLGMRAATNGRSSAMGENGTGQGLRGIVSRINGEESEARNEAADTHQREASEAQNNAEAGANAGLGIVNGRPVIGDNFNDDNFYADYQNYARNNGMEGRTLYDFMTNGTADEWRAFLSDPYMAQYYDADYATYGDLANDDQAFQDYWEHYKPSTVNDIMNPESEFYYARGIYDSNLINDISSGAAQNGYIIPNVEGTDDEKMRASALSSQRENPEITTQLLNYITLMNILSQAEPGSVTDLSTDELNALAAGDPSIFGTANENGGNQPEVRENAQQFRGPHNSIDMSAMAGDAAVPAAGLADLVSYAMPGYGIIGQKEQQSS